MIINPDSYDPIVIMSRLFLLAIDYSEVRHVTREWTSTRFTWGEGNNEVDHEDGYTSCNLRIKIYSSDKYYCKHYFDTHDNEIVSWLFSDSLERRECACSNMQNWQYILQSSQRGSSRGYTYYTSKDKYLIAFLNGKNTEKILDWFPDARLLDVVVHHWTWQFDHWQAPPRYGYENACSEKCPQKMSCPFKDSEKGDKGKCQRIISLIKKDLDLPE